jgi:hypothetical protein
MLQRTVSVCYFQVFQGRMEEGLTPLNELIGEAVQPTQPSRPASRKRLLVCCRIREAENRLHL